MKPDTKRAAESQAPGNSGMLHSHNLGSILVSCLERRAVEPEDVRALSKACSSPMALVALQDASARTKGAEPSSNAKGVEPSASGISWNEARFRNVAAKFDDSIVVLVSYEDAFQFVECVKRGNADKLLAEVSLPFESIEDIPRQYELLLFSRRNTGNDAKVDAKDNALAYLVSEIRAKVPTDSLLHPALATLARYDEANQSNLLNTLRVYLEHDRNAQRCAGILYLHRNSLQYRVRRIQEIAGVNLDDPEERAYLRLSFLLS